MLHDYSFGLITELWPDVFVILLNVSEVMSGDSVGWHPEVLLCFAAGLKGHADVFCIEVVSVTLVDTELDSCITTPFVVV